MFLKNHNIMLGQLKITAAAFICAAFIFRLLIINVDTISSIGSIQNGNSAKENLLSSTESNKYLDQLHNSKNLGFYEGEIVEEEDSDDEGQFKFVSFLFVQSFCSQIEYALNNTLTKSATSHNYFTYNTSPRYLALQVIRI